jgi:choline dehydrogenase
MAKSKSYDYIVVGGGSAGCVAAARLSEDPSVSVLVLEAGRGDWPWDLFIHMPAALTFPSGNPLYDWRYESEPEPFMHGRRIAHARGKVLGGSSSINGMIFQRGNPLDYERWGAIPGLESWDYAHCLPYFKKMEDSLASKSDDPFRGHGGPLQLEKGPATNPLFQAFFDAAVEAGYSRTDDVNGFKQEGFGPFDRNVRKGKRLSAARAYLHPVMDRPNLTVLTRALTTRIVFDGSRATGVEYRRNGRLHRVSTGEVVLAGGSINSPQLLQLSGVGAADHLRGLDIPVVADVPGVGENLQDHLEVYVQHASLQPVSMQPYLRKSTMPLTGLKWLLGRTGPAATNHFEGGGFVRSNDEVDWPNLMFHFLPVAVRYDGQIADVKHGYQVHIGPMYADTIGHLRIRSTDPTVHPELVFNYLSTERDRKEWVEAIHVARDILSQPALAPFDGGEISPGPEVTTDAEILDWVGREAETALHPCGTAKLGPDTDPMAVTNPDTMGVHGVTGVRIVDASVMPFVTNANIYAPVMMIAEKAADLIRGAAPLPAEHTPFYVAKAGERA